MMKENIEWSKNHFRMLKDGGTWAVPRSGLIWRKRGDQLVLVERMPWMEGMPITPVELKQQQDSDVDVISSHMRAAGVKVTIEYEANQQAVRPD